MSIRVFVNIYRSWEFGGVLETMRSIFIIRQLMTEWIIQRIPIQYCQLSPLGETKTMEALCDFGGQTIAMHIMIAWEFRMLKHTHTKPIQRRFDDYGAQSSFWNDANMKPINRWAQHKLLMPKLHNVQFDGTNVAIQISSSQGTFASISTTTCAPFPA